MKKKLTLLGLGHVCSHVQLFVTPWTVVHQALLLMGFSQQEYWSRLPFPSMRIGRLLVRSSKEIKPTGMKIYIIHTLSMNEYIICQHADK